MNRQKIIEPQEGSVDVVYIRCDSNHPDYIKNRNLYSKQYNLNNYWSETRDHGEITKSIKSVRKNMQWVRNIFICAPKYHKVKNLDEEKYNVIYVTNEDILGKENCPNFNSHSLELYTYKIKGLSEYFIQFNDDFFIFQMITIDEFYNFRTKKIKYLYENILLLGEALSFSTKKCIYNIMSERYYFWASHSPRMYYKKDIVEINERYKKESEYTKKSKFRDKNDFQLTHFYGYYLLFKERGEFIIVNNTTIKESFSNSRILIQKFYCEFFFSVIQQIFLQVFYKKFLYKNKIFLDEKIYSLINIKNNYIKNKENIDYAINHNVKFICLNDSYDTKDDSILNNISKNNYLYFYNELFKKGKK